MKSTVVLQFSSVAFLLLSGLFTQAQAGESENTFQRQVELFQKICIGQIPSYKGSMDLAETEFDYTRRQKHRGGAYLYSDTEPFYLYIRVDGECHVDGQQTLFSKTEANALHSSLSAQGFSVKDSLVAPDDGTNSYKSFYVLNFEAREFMFRISYSSDWKTSSVSILNR